MGGCYIVKFVDQEEPICYLGISFSSKYLSLVDRRFCEFFLIEQVTSSDFIHALNGHRYKLIKLNKDNW